MNSPVLPDPNVEPETPVVVLYLRALAIVAVAILFRYWFDPFLQKSGFVVFLAAIFAAAWVGGLGPSLIAQTLILMAEGIWFSHAPSHGWQFSIQAAASMAAFYGVGISVALISESRHAAQRRARAQQHEASSQREQLHATLSCIGDGVFVTDVNGLVTLMNPFAETMTGWSIDEARNRPLHVCFDIRNESSQALVESPLDRVVHDGQIVHEYLPVVLLTKDGRRVPVSYTAAPIHDSLGQLTGVVLIVRDESERRNAEQALRNADRRKDEFLATLAHELRNPLAPICMGLELMKLSEGNQSSLEELRSMMERQTHHMVRLIDDLLDVSRITRGRLELRKSPVELVTVVQNAVDATRPLIDEAKHRLSISLPPQPILLYADPNRITQVLSNLLNNAAKYTPPGGQIDLTCVRQDGEVNITVSDNGQGIPSDRLEFVFEMFAQVNGAIERGHNGLGIGLTLAKSLTEMHGGSIEVESEGKNRGSRFSIRFPVLHLPVRDETCPAPAPSSASAQSHRILVVDDNEDALLTLSAMVGRLGHSVCRARDGYEAVEAARKFHPNVVLMDLGMPNLNGYEAVRRIRQEPWGQQMIVIATTGWGQENDRRRTKEVGFDHHLVKPIEITALRDLLTNLPQRNQDSQCRPSAENATADFSETLQPCEEPEPSLS